MRLKKHDVQNNSGLFYLTKSSALSLHAVPFTPATFPFCFKFPYCKETINLAQRFNPDHAKVVLDFDMLYHTETRNAFCKEWKEMNGDEGEELYTWQKNRILRRKKIIGPSGPTGTSYTAFLVSPYMLSVTYDTLYFFNHLDI